MSTQIPLFGAIRGHMSLQEHTVKQAGGVSLSAIGSIIDNMPRSIIENILEGVHVSILGVYLGAS